jgi:hypothetical protein
MTLEATDCWLHLTFYHGYKIIPQVLMSFSYNWFGQVYSFLGDISALVVVFISGDKFHMPSFY